jgi:transglutaminase-like putative cysteine protease
MRELRRLGVVAGVLGQLSAAVAGVVAWPLLPVVVVLYVGAAVAAERATEQRARWFSGAATAVAVVLALFTVPGLGADRDGLRTSLGLLLVLIQVAHALTWRVRRDVQTGLCIAAALLVLAASFAPDVLVGLPLVAGWAVVVAGAVTCVDAHRREGVDVDLGGRPAPVLAATATALALGLGCFLLVPNAPTPAERNPLAGLTSFGSVAGRGAVTYSASRLDLRARGSLSDRPLLEVPADSPPLWRSQVFGFYSGLAWSATSGQLRPVPGPPWTVGTATGSTRADEAVRRGGGDSVTWLPAEAVAIDGRGGAVITDGDGNVRTSGLRRYTVTSVPQERDAVVLRAAAGSVPGDDFWLQLPTELPSRVRGLAAQLTAGAPTRYDAVLAVETWLRANARYTLDSPVPGRGEDAVDRFLFVDRVGFCEQFAAAETVLLRAAGIPARLATGLSAGVPAKDGRRVFREKDLHAWVEVRYPGVGWSPSDPTAGTALVSGGGGTSLRARLSLAVGKVLSAAQSVPGGRTGLAGLLLLTAVAIAVLARLHRPRRAKAVDGLVPPRAVAAPGPALAAFLRYDERLGERRRRPHESLAELGRRLEDAPRSALAVVEAECYGPSPPPGAAQAAELLDQLQPSVER